MTEPWQLSDRFLLDSLRKASLEILTRVQGDHDISPVLRSEVQDTYIEEDGSWHASLIIHADSLSSKKYLEQITERLNQEIGCVYNDWWISGASLEKAALHLDLHAPAEGLGG